ncbi:hypothetical protein EI555_019717 [Monodon monoceros]|uniref:Uncharacterized protein n=1 Tax=Monodon monoceros TaxID=40151 RepID=A0A4V5P9K5_MONMO|nr:hypothetical protein EI555_019717 [Monodon monoceros]
MGITESREGRRASLGMDQEERVRVLQGIRELLISARPAPPSPCPYDKLFFLPAGLPATNLYFLALAGGESSLPEGLSFNCSPQSFPQLSENVVNRMKDPGQPSRVGPLTPAAAALVSSEGREKESKSRRPESGGGRRPSGAEVDLLKRCDRGQAVVQDELLQVVTRDTEAAAKPRSTSLRQGEGGMDPETHRSAQLVSVGPWLASWLSGSGKQRYCPLIRVIGDLISRE